MANTGAWSEAGALPSPAVVTEGAAVPDELARFVMHPRLAVDGPNVVLTADVAFGAMVASALVYRPSPEVGWLFCALEAGEGQVPWDRPSIAHVRDGWVTVVWGRRIFRVPTDYVPTQGRLEGVRVSWHPDGTIAPPIEDAFGTVWTLSALEDEANTLEAKRLIRIEENLEPLVEAGLLPPLAMLDLSEVEADDVDPLPLLCEVFGPTGGTAHGFLFHDWRFGQETDDVIAEFVACLPEPLDLTQLDVMSDILRVRFEGEEESIDVHTENLNAVASYLNGKLEDKGRPERVHGIETDGDFFAFLVRRPEALPALEELGLAFYDP